jgi:hypothetical protein
VAEAGGKVRHTDLIVYQYLAPQFGRLVNPVGLRVRGGLGQTTNGESGCAFADAPRDAPVIHLNGPLALRLHSAVVERRGSSTLTEAPFRLGAGGGSVSFTSRWAPRAWAGAASPPWPCRATSPPAFTRRWR